VAGNTAIPTSHVLSDLLLDKPLALVEPGELDLSRGAKGIRASGGVVSLFASTLY
jgi:hypothetical protein